MDITIHPGKLSGTVEAIPSKSLAHRLLICAAFADHPTTLICRESSEDIEATVNCLKSLGTKIIHTNDGFLIHPIRQIPQRATLHCGESGSTLRFLLPIAGALGIESIFHMEGTLPQRPLSPLWEEMERMGCTLRRLSPDTLLCSGKLRPGRYRIAGNVSSQFISGLLFALSLMDADSCIEITGKLESEPYVKMTQWALRQFTVISDDYTVKGNQRFRSPGILEVEGDWSNGSFWLAANSLGSHLSVTNLNTNSLQGDRAVVACLKKLNTFCTLSAQDIPDLIPVLSIVAAANQGAVFTDIQRLRLKESDRVDAILHMIHSLGGQAEATEDSLHIFGTGLTGGVVDSMGDHRIAMAAAIASTVCTESVTILGAEAVNKSYPNFWTEFARLGGKL